MYNLPENQFKSLNTKIFGFPRARANSIMTTQSFKDLIDYEPKFVFVQLGDNDINDDSNAKTIAADLIKIYKYLKKRNIFTVIGDLIIRTKPYLTTAEVYQSQSEAIRKILKKQLPKKSFIRHVKIDEKCLQRDGVHLNGRGFKIFIKTIKTQMIKFLKSI